MHAVNEFGRDGFSDVLCGNGNFCGRNTTGPGICSKPMIFIRACTLCNVFFNFEKILGRQKIPYESPILGQPLNLISPPKINLFEPRFKSYDPYDMAN